MQSLDIRFQKKEDFKKNLFPDLKATSAYSFKPKHVGVLEKSDKTGLPEVGLISEANGVLFIFRLTPQQLESIHRAAQTLLNSN